VGEDEGRLPDPTATVIDAQGIKTSANVPASGQGIDASQNIGGRERSILIAMTGLLLTVLFTAASIRDSTAGKTLVKRLAAAHRAIRRGWAPAVASAIVGVVGRAPPGGSCPAGAWVWCSTDGGKRGWLDWLAWGAAWRMRRGALRGASAPGMGWIVEGDVLGVSDRAVSVTSLSWPGPGVCRG
jgi:hypothetical protein